ncbi:ABC transporter ATP-binding protein [Homoserinimonas sp. A447]
MAELIPQDDGVVLEAEYLTRDFRVSQPWPKRPKTFTAVDGVSLLLRRGKTLGIVGESGCGKSTLSRMLAGTLAHTSGRILIDGQDIGVAPRRSRAAALRRVQMIFQSPYTSLNPRISIARAVAEPLTVRGFRVPASVLKTRLAEVLDHVGLTAKQASRFPHELSGGQLQRAGIARALIAKPAIVICDEPTSALDVSIQSQILDLLTELQRETQVSYVFVSHDLAVVASLAHDIAVMRGGSVVEYGATEAIVRTPQEEYTKLLLSNVLQPDPTVYRGLKSQVVAH